jgi:hypothetical protein
VVFSLSVLWPALPEATYVFASSLYFKIILVFLAFGLSHLSSAAFAIISGSHFAWPTHSIFLSKIYFLSSKMFS